MAKANTQKTDSFESPVPDNKLPVVVALLLASRNEDKAAAFLYIDADDANALRDIGFANVATPGTDGAEDVNGRLATQLNEKGIEFAETLEGVGPAEGYSNKTGNPDGSTGGNASGGSRASTGYKRPDAIEIETGVALPTIARGRSGENSYPFDQLPINGSFHIKATDTCPDPSKSVASSVSAANLKYSEPVKDDNGNVVTEEKRVRKGTGANKTFEMKSFPVRKQLRTFTVRSVGDDDPKGKGCRVWRTQ